MKMKVKKGDTVRLLRGRDAGKTGKIIRVWPPQRRVLVEGVQMVQRHIRPKRAGEKGQRLAVAATLPVSNVQLICPSCKRGTRVGIKRQGSERWRICKKCQAVIE